MKSPDLSRFVKAITLSLTLTLLLTSPTQRVYANFNMGAETVSEFIRQNSFARTAGPLVWTVDSMTRVARNAPAGSAKSVTLYSAKREVESFQIAVQAPAGSTLTNTNVVVSDLTSPDGTIDAQNIELYREHYIHVTTGSGSIPNAASATNKPLGPGWYADGLIPFKDYFGEKPTYRDLTGPIYDAAPFRVDGTSNQVIWVDVFTPAGTIAGTYTGSATVTSAQGSVVVPITLHVWNFELPLKRSLHAYAETLPNLSPTGEPPRTTLSNEIELLKHGFNPTWVSPANERFLMDTYGLDRVNILNWSGSSYRGCQPIRAPYTVDQVRAEVAKHQPGLFLFTSYANEIWNCLQEDPSLLAFYMTWARNLREGGAHPDLVTYPVASLMGTNIQDTAADVWSILPKHFNASSKTRNYIKSLIDNPTTEVWLYNPLNQDNFSPKLTIDYLPINSRILHGFINQALGAKGTKMWRVDYWTSTPWTQKDAYLFDQPGEGDITYRGDEVGLKNQVIAGMRMKWFRDGVEDYEYIEILKRILPASALKEVHKVATGLGDVDDKFGQTRWTKDSNILLATRQEIGNKIDAYYSSRATATPQPTSK